MEYSGSLKEHVNDGKGEVAGKKLFAIYNGKEPKEVNPSLLWDFIPIDNTKPLSMELDKTSSEAMVIDSVEKYYDRTKK